MLHFPRRCYKARFQMLTPAIMGLFRDNLVCVIGMIPPGHNVLYQQSVGSWVVTRKGRQHDALLPTLATERPLGG